MKRQIISFIIAIVLIMTLATSAFAAEAQDYASMSNVQLAELTDLPIEDLIEAREMYGDEFNDAIEAYFDSFVSVNRTGLIELADAETGTIKTVQSRSISDSNWNHLSATFKKGQLLITYDSNFLGYNYGHAAILYSTTQTVEHLGPKGGATYSDCYSVSWWKESFSSMKTLNYSDPLVMIQAANYAYNNLQGLEYNAVASRDSAKVNCASLVWKAYNSTGTNIVDSTSGAVYPQYFDTSSKLSWVRSVGWNNVNWE